MKRKKVTGVFDCRETKCREYWIEGKVVSSVPAAEILVRRRDIPMPIRKEIPLWSYFPGAPILHEFALKPAYAIKLGDIIALQKPDGKWLHGEVRGMTRWGPSVRHPHGGVELRLPDGRKPNPEYDPSWQPKESATVINFYEDANTDPDRLVLVEINWEEITE
ncbi:hypothetical protein [Pantoea phage Nafs113]|nr:hypothetical protein [Pantoea phage Nafs113]